MTDLRIDLKREMRQQKMPSRMYDALIWRALFAPATYVRQSHINMEWCIYDDPDCRRLHRSPISDRLPWSLRFTESLDDAMRLLPAKGLGRVSIEQCWLTARARKPLCTAAIIVRGPKGGQGFGAALTPAVALCAAVLDLPDRVRVGTY